MCIRDRVYIGWIFFRSATISDAWYILTHLHKGLTLANIPHTTIDPYQWVSLVLAITVLLFHEWLYSLWLKLALMATTNGLLRFMFDYAILLWIIFFASFSRSSFIYFQF